MVLTNTKPSDTSFRIPLHTKTTTTTTSLPQLATFNRQSHTPSTNQQHPGDQAEPKSTDAHFVNMMTTICNNSTSPVGLDNDLFSALLENPQNEEVQVHFHVDEEAGKQRQRCIIEVGIQERNVIALADTGADGCYITSKLLKSVYGYDIVLESPIAAKTIAANLSTSGAGVV